METGFVCQVRGQYDGVGSPWSPFHGRPHFLFFPFHLLISPFVFQSADNASCIVSNLVLLTVVMVCLEDKICSPEH